MSTQDTAPGHTPEAAPRKGSSTAAKLVQAAALAAVLVPLGSVAMEADTITCGFSGYNSDGNVGGSGCSIENGVTNRYEFGDYFFELTFNGLDPNANFDVSVTNNEMTEAEFNSRAALFPGYDCIPLTEGGPCIDFVVDFPDGYPNPPSSRPWTSYDIEIHWTWDSENNGYPGGAGPIPNVRILHDIGGTATNAYDEDMCLVYNNCVYDPDPGIRSGDTDFRSFTAAFTVPEPSSLILLTAGIGGVLFKRRRRQQRG